LGVALRQLAGGISGRMIHMRSDLIDLLADLEAGLDFVEDGIEFVSRESLIHRIRRSDATVEELLWQCQGRSQSGGRRRVVLAGLPNAGKSTLFNALLSRDAALVSSRAGTTRDYLSGTIEWQAVPVELIDTPGWETDTPNGPGDNEDAGADEDLTRQSQELGARQRQQADLILWCSSVGANASERLEDVRIRMREIERGRPLVIVGTKCDLIEQFPPGRSDSQMLLISARTGKGLANLVERCASILAGSASGGTEILGTTAARCRESLAHCREALTRAAGAAESSMGDEIVALELRESLEQLGRVLGTVYTDDVLGRIFSRFCIGK
jgi:tRNA modification GTPase